MWFIQSHNLQIRNDNCVTMNTVLVSSWPISYFWDNTGKHQPGSYSAPPVHRLDVVEWDGQSQNVVLI